MFSCYSQGFGKMWCSKNKIIFLMIIFATLYHQYLCIVYSVQQMICKIHDKNFVNITLCEVRLDKQKVPRVYLSMQLLQLPVTNCDIHVELINIDRSRKPSVLYKGDWDACAFMKRKSRYKLLEMLYSPAVPYTDVNHTCPYNHDIHLLGYPVVKVNVPLPIPSGQYQMKGKFAIDKKVRHEIWVTVKAS